MFFKEDFIGTLSNERQWDILRDISMASHMTSGWERN